MTLCSCAQESGASLGLLAWNRAAFGPRPGALDNFNFEQFLEEQLHPTQIDDRHCQGKLDEMEFETLEKSYQDLWTDHYLPMDDAESDEDWDWIDLPRYETVQARLLRAVSNNRH